MQLRPMGDQVVVRMPPRVERIGSVIVPDTVPDEQTEGEVIACGPDAIEVAPGDTVVFRAYAGTENTLDIDGREYRFLHEDELLGVVEDA